MSKRGKDMAVGTMVAAAVGYVIGVLTAPKSGRETRRDIQQAAMKAKADAEKNLKQLYSEIDARIDQGREQLKTASAKVREEYSTAIDSAQKVKDKARQILSRAHEGDVERKELDKAVKDVKSALEHLKKYASENVQKKK